ncbi:MAG: DUF58 domain-containing protein [Armatimonadota bacterium]|jgi:uncharacterized protein (DUF58 family)
MGNAVSSPGSDHPERSSAKTLAVILVCGFLFVVAFILGARPLYVMFAAGVSVPLVSYAIGRTSLRRLQVQRRMASHMSEGESQEVRLRVTNTGRLRKLYACLEDELPEWLQSSAPEGHLIADLGAGESSEVAYDVTALKRGVYRVGPVRMWAGDPAGLFDYRARTAEATELIVYPVGGRLPSLAVGRGTPFAAATLGRRPVADGTDFRSIREYRPGDPLRRIHWKSSAHAGEFHVIEFEESIASDVALALDLTAGSEVGAGKDTTLEYGIKLTVAMAEHALANRSSCRLTARAKIDRSVNCRNAVQDLPRLLEALARTEADCPERFAGVLNSIVPRLDRGASLTVVTPSTDDEIVDIVRRLVMNGVSVHVFCLRADSFGQEADKKRRAALSARYATFVSQMSASGAQVREITCGSDPVVQIGGR